MADKITFGPPTNHEGGKPPDRLPRPIMPMASWGGFIEIGKPLIARLTDIDVPGGRQTDRWLIEVQLWEVIPMFTWVEIPMCGGKGAMTRRLVCSDFKWRALLVWDTIGVEEGEKRTTRKGTKFRPFPDSAFNGYEEDKFTVSLFFQLGEPAKYPESLELGAYYYMAQATVENVRMVLDANTRQSIGAAVSGAGSSPVTRWYGNDWRGGGGFGFSQREHGFTSGPGPADALLPPTR